MATGTTNAISKDSGSNTQIRLYYSSTFNAATSESTVSITPQLYCSSNLGNDIRFYAYGGSNAGVYGGATTSTSRLYSVGGNYGGSDTLRATGCDWDDLDPYSGSIQTFKIKHGTDGKATFYGGVVGTVIPMVATSLKSTYDDISGNKSGCTATITVSAPYSITYNANGGSGAPSSQSVFATYSYNLSATSPTRTGYTFKGWATSSSATTAQYQPSASVTISGNLALYAVWQINSYNVTLTAGTNVASVSGGGSKNYGSTVKCTATLGSATGYTYAFDGWYNGSTKESSANPYTFTMPASAKSLTAKGIRTPNNYTVTVNKGDYISSVSGGGSKAYDSSVTVTATVNTSTAQYTYAFDGWYNGTTRVSTSASYTFTCKGAVTLTAKATRTPVNYTLSLTAGTDVASVSGGGSKAYGSSVTATATLGSTAGYNYSFDGWYNGSTKESSSNPYTFTMPASNKSLTAKATKVLKTYSVTYNANGGSSTPSTQTKTYGVTLTLASAISRASTSPGSYTVTYNYNGNGKANTTATSTRTTNYTFSKWNTKQDGSGTNYNAGASYTTNAALALYAQWTSSETRAAVTLPSATWTGRTFNGWYDAASGGTKIGNAGGSYTPSGNKTLYAHWTLNTYTYSATAGTDIASVSLNGTSSTTTTSATVNYGSSNTFEATLGSNAAYTYTFSGWYNGTTKVSSDLTYTVASATGALALTAKASKTVKSYKLTLSSPNIGGSATVRRTSSPNGGGATGVLSNNATIYYGDVLQVSYTENAGYEVDVHTINGSTFTSPTNVTVTGNVTVVVSMKNAGVVWVWTGSAWEKYLPVVWTGSAWERHIPMVWTGSAWEIY